tara:strand:- start:62 stop:328 length:267 start_codon:yes stop_codon:yes gene_type:complete
MDINKRTLTSTEEAVLKNELLDIQKWVNGAIDGKINNCKLRMCEEWRKILYADESVTQIPSDNNELVALIIARDDYKSALERQSPEPE